MSGPAGDLSIDRFLPFVGSDCEIGLDGSGLAMTLTAAEPLQGSIRAAGGFRLEFLGPPNPILPQSIMTVEGEIGAHKIFLVPIGSDRTGTRYEAVFY